MTETPKAPNRTRTPDEYGYVLVDKNSFKELVHGVKSVLKKQLKFTHTAVIRVDGFQSGFEGEELFTETLMPKEWINLKNIHVYFYPKDKGAHGYSYSLSVRLGGYSAAASGLSISYGEDVDDIQRIAIKQDLEVLFSSYTRKVILSDILFASALVFLTSFGLIYYLYSTFKDRMNELGGIGVIILITGIFYIAWMMYLLAMGAHHKIMPHFEAAEDVKNTRMQRVGKIAGFIVLIIGLIGTILSIAQFFSLGR